MQRKLVFSAMAIDAVNGLTPYMPGKPIEELERELGLKGIVKLASNENPKGPSENVRLAIQQAIKDVSLYPDGNGYYLKQALAKKYSISSDRVTLGNGSNDVLDLIARVFLGPGREAVYSEHAFVVYSIATQSVSATARVAKAYAVGETQAYGHDLTAMRALVGDKTAVVFIANPNNPTGTWLETAELEHFINELPDHVIVVLDEAYCEYSEHHDASNSIDWVQRYPSLIVTRTFSKAYGLAGLRVGYAISHPDIADLLNRVRQPFNVNSLALVAAQVALADEAYIAETRELNQQGLLQLQAGFTALDLSYIPSIGNFITVDVGSGASAVYESLLREGVIVRPVAAYGLPNHLRVTVGSAEQNEALLRALARVLACV
ncbi:MAG: histidinol-phosphate transaminase [Piscirickettsiaceae bacterium]|nr:MAG: histidinol-phosphate transaminase [Piscirickettsiaceae bacterium]PCI67802.1 MAG: histidinol-phosphate transaminase [Piscirickettsiaceae bacterium]